MTKFHFINHCKVYLNRHPSKLPVSDYPGSHLNVSASVDGVGGELMWSCLFFSLESMLGTLKYDSEEYSHCTVHVRLLNCYLACYANRLFWLVPSLCFTARLSAARLTWKWFSIPVEIKLIFTRKVLHLASFWKWDSEVAYLSFLGTAWRLGRCCVELHLGTITEAKSDVLSYANSS